MYLLGCDIGSSSVKVSIVDANNGNCAANTWSPLQEMPIRAVRRGWAEQDPETWWQNLKVAVYQALKQSDLNPSEIKAIGISYQMHGLVMVDKNYQVIRPSIIWCDSRAVNIGDRAIKEIGRGKCLKHLLNSPGNFTASKLKWVKENEPGVYDRIFKIMLPGDYIAMRMTGEIMTTVSGLSEGIFWDFANNDLAGFLLDYYGFNPGLIPDLTGTFALQGRLSKAAAGDLGLMPGTPLTYRAGDQPNNAFSLRVLNPGEVAANAGTSGVVYGVSDRISYDEASRVNTFAHVNHTGKEVRLGVLLCINGTGIQYSWIKRNLLLPEITYDDMNKLASGIPAGSEGITTLPFGNGAERMLGNQETGSAVFGMNFNIHHTAHLVRAALEGIAFSFKYGMEIMEETGISAKVIRASYTNMFLSPVFRQTLADISGSTIELYETDGSQGAARGAGVGSGFYSSAEEAFPGLRKIGVTEPEAKNTEAVNEAYNRWLRYLMSMMTLNKT
ncbi:MAG: FGGY family carbohydrate kinase [Bacteroidetes bacterium]|nr:FGGY family carbohydrate kinase [Bacteroidota bacterium]